MSKRRVSSCKTLKVENESHCTTPSDRADCQLVSVKVGCLYVNPATKHGRRMYMLQMFVLCFVPHAALLVQNCTIMAQLSQTLDLLLYAHRDVDTSLSLGKSIVAFQDERHYVANYITWYSMEIPDSASNNTRNDTERLQQTFAITDLILEGTKEFVQEQLNLIGLYHFRKEVMDKDFKDGDPFENLRIYEEVNAKLLLDLLKNAHSTKSSLWRLLSSCYELHTSLEKLSIILTAANLHPNSHDNLERVALMFQYQVAARDHLYFALHYLEVEEMYKEAGKLTEIYNWISNQSLIIRNKYVLSLYHDFHSYYYKMRDVQIHLWDIVRRSVQQEVWAARRTLAAGVAILVTVLVATPILILLITHTVTTIQTFTRSIDLSTQRLVAEKQKSDLLLSRMLPAPVLKRLRAQRTVPAEAFDAVTIFFSDIVGFTNISANSTPMEVINMLNILYKLFDERILQHDVYKVETIGDAYMVVSGLPQTNGNRHASEIADMSLSLMRSLDGARVPHRNEEHLKIRAGINTGPCVAGVVGTAMPRYCLFGDTINTASRMESTGEAMKIHISETTKMALDEIGGYEVESRGILEVPGKGMMETFWLVGKVGGIRPDSPKALRLKDFDQNIIELFIES